MIITDYFVYIHTSRHAGSFINRLILENVSGAQGIRYHGQLSDLPDEYKHLPVIGFIRNPWDWYVSMYFDYKSKKQYIFEIISENGSLDFSKTIERFIRLGDESELSNILLNKLVAQAPDNYLQQLPLKLIMPGILKKHFKEYPNHCGYYSWVIKKMHEVDGVFVGQIGRFENLRADLLSLFDITQTPITSTMYNYINKGKAINTSQRNKSYQAYYETDLKDLIYEKDQFIIDKFSYQF